MCTALSLNTRQHYFGRNLDLAYRYDERVVVTPRNYPLPFRRTSALNSHWAMIGIAFISGGYPLYYDATNEKGLSMAALSFPGSAVYHPPAADRDNVSPFEFIPYVLARCACTEEARRLLEHVCLADLPFSPDLPLSPLHWIIADRNSALTVESVENGLHIFDNPAGVLTNNPPFDYQMTHLADYMTLTPSRPENTFAPSLNLTPYGLGMGALGLPGDCSPASRFVRTVYAKVHSICGDSECESVSQFFHILSNVRHVRGSVEAEAGPEITVYSSCCNTDKGVYYYTTYENSRISAIDMHRENLNSDRLITYPLLLTQDILYQN